MVILAERESGLKRKPLKYRLSERIWGGMTRDDSDLTGRGQASIIKLVRNINVTFIAVRS